MIWIQKCSRYIYISFEAHPSHFTAEQPWIFLLIACRCSLLQAVLHFVYRDNLVDDDELSASGSDCSIFGTLAGKIMAAADKYELPRLRLLCESYLCKHISVNSVATTLALADRHNAAELKSICLKFAAENLSGIRLHLTSAYSTQIFTFKFYIIMTFWLYFDSVNKMSLFVFFIFRAKADFLKQLQLFLYL
jgi:hypothetical protein